MIKCDVCAINNSTLIANSQLAEQKIYYCKECVAHNAEPEWLFELTFGKVDFVTNDSSIENLSTYIDGKYVSWNQWIKINDGV